MINLRFITDKSNYFHSEQLYSVLTNYIRVRTCCGCTGMYQ